jgi:ABC-2 type transport system ATP-binding protein
LEPFKNRRAGKLSGGMKQKLALSCTLIHTPDLLILDEPTTGVDPLSRQEFWDILREIASTGQSLLISTPYMDEAMLCHRIALMHHGRVLAIGKPQNMTALFKRRLLEITGHDLRAALQQLKSANLSAIDINRFGDRLHVVFDENAQEQAVRAQLSGFSLSIKEAQPTIEDTFVELMKSHAEAA